MCNLILLYSKYIFHSSVFDLSSSPSLCYFSLFTLFLYVYSPTISAFSLSLSPVTFPPLAAAVPIAVCVYEWWMAE